MNTTRPMCIVVTDDVTQIQKSRDWAAQNGFTFKCFTTRQWHECLENPSLRSNVGVDAVFLATGSTPVGGELVGKVLQFPPSRTQGERKVATMDELESEAIRNAISEYKGNLTEAAKALGIGRATLYRKVKQYNIDPSTARNKVPKAA